MQFIGKINFCGHVGIIFPETKRSAISKDRYGQKFRIFGESHKKLTYGNADRNGLKNLE
jgi:hypothetical protein